MKEYKAGADQDIFALTAFGRSCSEVYKYQNLTNDKMKEAAELAKSYGLVIDGDAAEATKKMSYQLNVMGIMFDAIKIKVGNEMFADHISIRRSTKQRKRRFYCRIRCNKRI